MNLSELGVGLTIYICLIACLLGLVMGSFLNCMAIRIVNGESIARGRSHCMSCGHVLGVKDLVPLFSWLSTKGKCRYCGEPISIRYPITELVSAICYVAVVLKFGVSFQTIEFLILTSLMLVISFCDIEDYIIPDRFIITGILVRIAYLAFESASGIMYGNEWLDSLIGGLSISLPVLIVALVMEKILKRDAMGGGDIKLLFMIGIYFSWPVNLLSMLLSCIFGIIIGLALRRKNERLIPFGPAICAGSFIGMICGLDIITAYLGLF